MRNSVRWRRFLENIWFIAAVWMGLERVAGVFLRDKTLVHRMRSIAFAVFTPFYFIKAGLFVSLPALWTGLLVIGAFLLFLPFMRSLGDE